MVVPMTVRRLSVVAIVRCPTPYGLRSLVRRSCAVYCFDPHPRTMKLSYFAIRGRGESIRIALAAAEQEWQGKVETLRERKRERERERECVRPGVAGELIK